MMLAYGGRIGHHGRMTPTPTYNQGSTATTRLATRMQRGQAYNSSPVPMWAHGELAAPTIRTYTYNKGN